jgi:hypothetical protein
MLGVATKQKRLDTGDFVCRNYGCPDSFMVFQAGSRMLGGGYKAKKSLTQGVLCAGIVRIRNSFIFFSGWGSRVLGSKLSNFQILGGVHFMIKKSALALCSMAVLVATFALPAAGQDAKNITITETSQGMLAQGTFKQITPATQEQPPPLPFFTMYDNFGTDTKVCLGCPLNNTELAGINQSGFVFTTLKWQPGGWLVTGPNDPNPAAGLKPEALAVPFVTPTGPKCPVTCSVTSILLPVQQTGYPGAAVFFAVSVWADNGLGVPTELIDLQNGFVGPGFVNIDAVPQFPSCCSNADYDVADFAYGGGKYLGPLSPGTGYWVVVDADYQIKNASAATSDGVWAFTQYANYGRISPSYNGGVWCTPSSTTVQCANLSTNNGGLTTASTLPAMKINGIDK